MIIYDHTTVLGRLFQWKGTVLQDTLLHVAVANAVTLVVLLFLQVDGVVAWQERPSWVPAPVAVQDISPLAWQLLMLPLGFLLGLRSNQAYGAPNSRTICLQPSHRAVLAALRAVLTRRRSIHGPQTVLWRAVSAD